MQTIHDLSCIATGCFTHIYYCYWRMIARNQLNPEWYWWISEWRILPHSHSEQYISCFDFVQLYISTSRTISVSLFINRLTISWFYTYIYPLSFFNEFFDVLQEILAISVILSDKIWSMRFILMVFLFSLTRMHTLCVKSRILTYSIREDY